MNQQNEQPSNGGTENQPATEDQTIAQNPNPRANENIKTTPIEKSTENDGKTHDVGTEITDGEGG